MFSQAKNNSSVIGGGRSLFVKDIAQDTLRGRDLSSYPYVPLFTRLQNIVHISGLITQ